MMPDDATKRQIVSADPSVSTWLSANAGSGKTRVLTDRVARLLLDEVPPQNILCLTYTKAAASEMQNRLFKRLGEWSMLEDGPLLQELTNLGAAASVTGEGLVRARTLFARAIETPGGLRIQTIHSFCASLLRRFPLEAKVSPVFREMEDRAAKLLRADIVEQIASSDDRALIQNVAHFYTGDNFDKLTEEITRHRDLLQQPKSGADIFSMFGLPASFDETTLLQQVFTGGEALLLQSVIGLLSQSTKKTDIGVAAKLRAIGFSTPNNDALTKLFSVFLNITPPGRAKISKLPTKEIRDANPEIVAELHEFMTRLEAGRDTLNTLNAARKTTTLYQFSNVFLPAYEAHKESRGWLDFDDLIGRAGALLSDPEVAQWVLYKLDGGIDHILVDEAQDTSPKQWRVIELLAQEFASGQGARTEVRRTIFVVGDLKQSIYSFQGASPLEYARMQEHFATTLGQSEQGFFKRSLTHSFRSSPAILGLVDAVFKLTDGQGIGGAPVHHAFFTDLPGRVDIWPTVPVATKDEPREWYDPRDMLARNDHRVVLAEKIACQIETMQREDSIPSKDGGFRPIRFDDFLILVQSRSPLFHEIIRACKSHGLPIAGADRLKIGAEIAVKDLIALMTFLSLPEDSLSLAAVLRSPIFGVSESELYDLAHHRHENDLWPALVRRQDDFQGAYSTLSSLLSQVDFLNPFELLERILTRHDGRDRLLARLGSEAEDAIDALLSQAVAYERTETPSLSGFLIWLAADEIEIKRQSDTAGNRIRVMTTHGAKGLESSIVILPDTGDRIPRSGGEILDSGNGFAMWRTVSAKQTEAMTAAIDRAKESQTAEWQRLLYVALTRAEKWLIVCTSGEVKAAGNSWYRLVESGMHAVGFQPLDTPAGQGLRHETGLWEDAKIDSVAPAPKQELSLPIWAHERAAPPPKPVFPVSPSQLGGEKIVLEQAVPDETLDALLRGSKIHLLLEHLPKHQRSDWNTVASSILERGEDVAGDAERDALFSEAERVLTNPAFSPIFGENSLAEINISASLKQFDNRRLNGTIDRLVVTPDKILVVDFKSNRTVPKSAQQTPVGILRQMAAYLDAVEQVYPLRKIELSILWTHTATLMVLPHDIVRAALETTPRLDDLEYDT